MLKRYPVPLIAILALILSFAVTPVTPAAAAVVTPAAGQYVPLTPARIVTSTLVTAGRMLTFNPLGKGGVPASGVAAIAYQLHAAGTGNGTLTAFPAGNNTPGTSDVNFVAGETVDNAVITKLGTGGQVSITNGATNGASATVYIDVVGYYTAAGSTVTGSTFVPLKPVRIVNGGTTTTGGTLDVAPLGTGGVPHSGVTAVVAHVTAQSGTAGAFLAYPNGITRPGASDLHYGTGGRYTAQTTVKLGADGTFRIYTTTAASLWVEIVGYYQDATGSATGSLFTPVTPARLPGTRPTVAADSTGTFSLAGVGGVPATGVSAVAFNVTAYSETGAAAGGLSVYASDESTPVARQLSYQANTRRWPTQQTTHLGQDGTFAVRNVGAGAVVMLFDVHGYFTPTGVRASRLPWNSGVNPQGQNTARANQFAEFRGAAVDNVTLFPKRDNWDVALEDAAQLVVNGLPDGFNPTRDDLIMTLPLWPGGGVNHVGFTGTQAQWQKMATTIASGDPNAYVRLGWEMNLGGYWALTEDNQADWQASFIQAVQWMKAAAPGLQFVWNPNKGHDQTCSNECSLQVLDEVHEYIDVYAIDSYDSWNPDLGDAGRTEHYDGYRRLNESLAIAVKYGKKFAVAEWGVACTEHTNPDPQLDCQWLGNSGGDNPQYIEDYMNWFAAHAGDLAFESYFDEPADYIRSALSVTPLGPLAPAAYQAKVAANRM
ncbi:hypothetical protein [Actinoplanes sp. NBRC 101535]|uniref:hypothetical protein n=1 Tax=Actinoplanes sp. NBRC 101535 TaxID=3032196 RepID=UPI0024A33F6A|nr:hypothetical protein [Actinoplanes sp. NBRC 101535]GLY07930.1 hypothetical protein Acsp01_83090 [Actinoplanes sp. NBRC 101535]